MLNKDLHHWLRAQGSRPRTQKISEAKDSPSEDRPFLGQGHRCKCSSKQKKKLQGLQIFFHAFKKKGLQKFFSGVLKKTIYKILRIPKILLFSSRGQGNFRGFEASRPRTSKCVLEDSTSVNGMYQ